MSSSGKLGLLPQHLQNCSGPSVWLEFSPLAQATQSINLGQGFPDWQPPDFVTGAASASISSGHFSQYAKSAGHPHLVNEIARQYRPRCDEDLDPAKNIIVTDGASEAIYLALLSLVEGGDEVIVLEPAFDIYTGAVSMVGGKLVSVPLRTRRHETSGQLSFYLDIRDLKAKLNQKTKALILNTPHNPTGKVFSAEEMKEIGRVICEFPHCTVISDEVYEHLIYDEMEHHSFAAVSGLFSQTLSIYSAGKTFSVTGWKIGWVIGPEELINRLQICQQWIVFSVATPLQEAIAVSLKQASKPYKGYSSYYSWLRIHYQRKRDSFFTSLQECGLNPILPQGTFFILTDVTYHLQWSDLGDWESYPTFAEKNGVSVDPRTLKLADYRLCRWLCLEKKVAAIPASAFYAPENQHLGERLIRFAFCKDDAVLTEGARRLSS